MVALGECEMSMKRSCGFGASKRYNECTCNLMLGSEAACRFKDVSCLLKQTRWLARLSLAGFQELDGAGPKSKY